MENWLHDFRPRGSESGTGPGARGGHHQRDQRREAHVGGGSEWQYGNRLDGQQDTNPNQRQSDRRGLNRQDNQRGRKPNHGPRLERTMGSHNISGAGAGPRGGHHQRGQRREVHVGGGSERQDGNLWDGQRDNNSNQRQSDRRGLNRQDNQRGRKPNHGPRPERTMGFPFVEKLIKNEDIQQVVLDLSNDRNGFTRLLESNEMSNDMVVLLVKLLRKLCDTTFQESKITLLSCAVRSRFMEKLTLYIMNVMNQSKDEKFRNRHFWNDPDEFWNCLIKLSKTVHELIPTNCEAIKKLLKNMCIFFPLIEDSHSMHISDEIKVQTTSLLDLVEKTMQYLEVRKQQVQQGAALEEEAEPLDDFRQIEIVPSAQEVTSEQVPILRVSRVNKAFDSVNQYLDIQFRLLREDFIAPLRRGICTFLRNQAKPKKDWKKLDDIKIYTPIRFLTVEMLNECNCYKIRFDFSKKKRTFTYENSKRFMFGSLVCFTNDNFKSLLFGKIVDRDVKLLEQGLMTIGFQQDVQVDFETDYLMVESSVYFEPYYQVLGVLKRMDEDNFPMERYIVKVETQSHPPEYLLRNDPVIYEVEGVRFWSLAIPRYRFFNLNVSQLDAFKAALTDEFCIIQGPPGTGKTFLGLRIAHTLLNNQHAWYDNTPMLVICYTNHALDQFLEGILPVTKNILRVGARSKNEALTQYNLSGKRRTFNHKAAVHQKRIEVRDCMQLLKTLKETLSQIDANESLVSFDCFREVIEGYENTWFAGATIDGIKKWLLEGKFNDREAVNQRNNQRLAQEGIAKLEVEQGDEPLEGVDLQDDQRYAEQFDDIFTGIVASSYRPLLTVKQLRDKLEILNGRLVQISNEGLELDTLLLEENIQAEIWEVNTDLDYLLMQLDFYGDPRNRRRPQGVNLQKPFNMRYADRWLLYYDWLGRYSLQLRRKYERNVIGFRGTFRLYNEMRDMEDTQLMKQHLVIGMTTTGAARLQSSLQALKSPIVIVEEAAEVLEAHIVAALTNHCKHLILIGDHLQLKPSAADYRMETKFNLGVSLFERMVKNNIKCHTLNVQHRMRPEISKLVKPHIYPQLEDHETTLQRNPILGVEKCLYFIDHREQEELCQDASKKNIHECKFLIALARHLILNGYKPEQITILATYLGQFFEMVREKKNPANRNLLQDVRISVLDNFQGEECDIILLSLVRSNAENKAGFLRIQNRVCVALSRARDGFFIMGDMSLLLKADSENQIWDKVNAVLKEQNAIGTHLTLRCQVHQYRFTQVSKGEDFVKLSEGGCDQLCGAQIGCGHACKRLCHVQDRDHQFYNCNEKCNRLLCNNPTHVCLKLCYENCGPCTYMVSVYLEDCGHRVNIACHIDPAKYSCKVPVLTKLPCDHETKKPCSDDPEKFKCPFPCDTRVEPCGHSCERKCHIRIDRDHLQYMCRLSCSKSRVGCRQTDDPHTCTKLCYQDCEECIVGVKKERSCGHVFKIACKLDIEEEPCEKPCKKTLSCGHLCKSRCSDKCGPCEVMVSKTIPDCGHAIKIKCSQAPERQFCNSKTCPRILTCGHKCENPCKKACTSECKKITECYLKTPCGHVLKNIVCHVKNTNDPKTLLQYCSHPCGAMLKCDHKCTGTCGECMQSRFHKRCNEKCGVPLVCNHECPIPCRQACKPCTQTCEMRCRHSKCKKICGEPCTPCKDKCARSCKHVECTKRCGEMCNVPPCDKKCSVTLRCGHPCVGFCGDPCPPLCRICDKEELTEIFFGYEDEEDAIFVLLMDCKHVLEHKGLEDWLNQGKDQIQFKTCPKCKTNITKTERYSEHVKMAIQDIHLAKTMSFGTLKDNEALCLKLLSQLTRLRLSSQLIPGCAMVLNALSKRLQPSRRERRQPISKIELNAVQSKIQTMSNIVKCCEKVKPSSLREHYIQYLNAILDVLLRSEDHVTDQEIEDMETEIKRLHRIVQLYAIKTAVQFKYAQTQLEVISSVKIIENYLFVDRRYTDTLDVVIKKKLIELADKVDSAMIITDSERIEIVRAMGFAKGHWYKCPNGHPYAIGECGGASQVAKCFCGERIGGTNHRLLETNQFAGEMDGATRHVWPGGLY